MKSPSTCTAYLAAYIAIALSLWTASQWWEKGLAERSGDPIVSPDGCYRLETFKPFWVLPNMLHRKPHPDEDVPPTWFPLWGYPGFYRLYDNRNGELISENKIYDLETAGWGIDWGEESGFVYAGMIPIGPNVPDCMGDRPTTRAAPQE